jgi:inorganic pyrophosphatase
MDLWKDLPVGENPPEEINVVIEIPKGSRNKYEYDHDTNIFKLDRVIYSPFYYDWGDYGFIPKTFCEDGDPGDVFVLMDRPTFPGCLIEARPVGLMVMIDSGDPDSKILAVPSKDPKFSHIKDIKDLSPHLLREIEHFFSHYKDLQGKKVEVKEWRGAEEAKKWIKDSMKLYNEKFGE